MKPLIIPIFCCLLSIGCSRNPDQKEVTIAYDSLSLTNMVSARETAMKNHDVHTAMMQFSDDATFINSAGTYFSKKTEIEKFHQKLTETDSFSYYYTAGKVKVRMLDKNNAIVYYPWRMDWYSILNPQDTLEKETGLMTLSAQKRNNRWLWIAITNQHTPEYFDDLTKHKILN